MNKVSVLELCALELCDCVLDSLISGDDIKMSFTGANPVKVLFKAAEIKELRILGYEVLNEDEEAVFDMPDIEVLGESIQDALTPLLEAKPHSVGFSQNDEGLICLAVSDDTDTYSIELSCSEIFIG